MSTTKYGEQTSKEVVKSIEKIFQDNPFYEDYKQSELVKMLEEIEEEL